MESMTFHIDSRWDGMAEMAVIPAKTYFIWNDMESIWIPCGIWGESKDLSISRDCTFMVF